MNEKCGVTVSNGHQKQTAINTEANINLCVKNSNSPTSSVLRARPDTNSRFSNTTSQFVIRLIDRLIPVLQDVSCRSVLSKRLKEIAAMMGRYYERFFFFHTTLTLRPLGSALSRANLKGLELWARRKLDDIMIRVSQKFGTTMIPC